MELIGLPPAANLPNYFCTSVDISEIGAYTDNSTASNTACSTLEFYDEPDATHCRNPKNHSANAVRGWHCVH